MKIPIPVKELCIDGKTRKIPIRTVADVADRFIDGNFEGDGSLVFKLQGLELPSNFIASLNEEISLTFKLRVTNMTYSREAVEKPSEDFAPKFELGEEMYNLDFTLIGQPTLEIDTDETDET